MILTNNPKPIKIIITIEECNALCCYITQVKCNLPRLKQYIGTDTIFFVIWHLEEMRSKMFALLLKSFREVPTKKYKMPVNIAEQKAFSICFKLIPADSPLILILENKLIAGLVKTYEY